MSISALRRVSREGLLTIAGRKKTARKIEGVGWGGSAVGSCSCKNRGRTGMQLTRTPADTPQNRTFEVAHDASIVNSERNEKGMDPWVLQIQESILFTPSGPFGLFTRVEVLGGCFPVLSDWDTEFQAEAEVTPTRQNFGFSWKLKRETGSGRGRNCDELANQQRSRTNSIWL